MIIFCHYCYIRTIEFSPFRKGILININNHENEKETLYTSTDSNSAIRKSIVIGAHSSIMNIYTIVQLILFPLPVYPDGKEVASE